MTPGGRAAPVRTTGFGSAGALLALALWAPALPAQADPATGYRDPPPVIRAMLDAPPTPAVLLAPDGRAMVLLGRAGLPDIAELAQPEVRLAGVRINPHTRAPVRAGSIDALTIRPIGAGQRRADAGQRRTDARERRVQLPAGARVGFVQWSPDGRSLAFGNVVDDGVELWVADAEDGRARPVLGPVLNAGLGPPFVWMPGGRALLVRRVPEGHGPPPTPPAVPAGPVVRQSDGRAAAVRTFPDMLAGPEDEAAFEHHFTARLTLVPLDRGAARAVGEPGIIASFSVAPDGRHVLVTRVQRPYSYRMGVSSFGQVTEVLDLAGERRFTVVDRDHIEAPAVGRDHVAPGRRSVQWRADAPATLVWVEAADGGDPAPDDAVHDRVLALDAPFTGEPRVLAELDARFAGIQWARPDAALVHSRRAATARVRLHVIDPSRPDVAPRLLWERSGEDRYGDPGRPVTATNGAGHAVVRLTPGRDAFYVVGGGASPDGRFPFLDRVDLATGRAERVWQAASPYHESVVGVLDDDARRIITRRESQDDPPNYFLRDRAAGSIDALTRFPDPAPQLAGIQRQLITYPRDDGVTLSATLFTPAGYDADRDGPLPVLLWAYPREYRDADAAGQVTSSPNRFSRPSGFSHLYLLARGYAILDGPAMPIVARDGREPNDTYVEQLVSSARAAVDAVVGLGVGDPDRIAVAGHSYGAFMTANLLAHTDLFRAGIALSGAYNRTLTPFGFQHERRSYWQARDVYDRMNVFAHADRIRAPLLLVHGADDSNPGTFPLQSERLYHALAGLGAPVRFVSLPHENHAYAARQSVGHVLAEMIDWLDHHMP